MQQFTLDTDIKVHTYKAVSFPEGVLAAHQYLHKLVPYSAKRKYFGISRPEGGKDIVYYAAAEEVEKGELEKHGLSQFIIRKGNYIYKDIADYMNNIPAIGMAFAALLQEPDIDPQGACVEWYLDMDTCRCMVRVERQNPPSLYYGGQAEVQRITEQKK